MRTLLRSIAATAATTLLAVTAATAVPTPAASIEPGADPFYIYDGPTPLAQIPPGTVLDSRTLTYSITGVPTPIMAVQLLYRSVDALNRPIANVTSIVKPVAPVGPGVGKAVAYQSFYDSLNPADSPSRSIAGGTSPGGGVASVETFLFAPLLAQGYSIIVADIEGQDADFAAGPEYGVLTLDSIRAASNSPLTGIPAGAPVGMIGYSGGAIGTSWAAALAPRYAPDVNNRLVGAAMGGLLVAPDNNLDYISGTPVWGGVTGMAIIGVARAYDIDFDQYLNAEGKAVLARMENASIGQVLGQYPDFRFERYTKPEFSDPRRIEPFVKSVNQLNLGLRPSPTIPVLLRMGGGGDAEGTPGNKPGIGPGDGVMIAGDARTLMRKYCADGTPVDYAEYPPLSHVPAANAWLPEASAFLNARFSGGAVSENCASIAPGNSLAPLEFLPPAGTVTGPARTRVKVRNPQVWQVKGRESVAVRFAVVSKRGPAARRGGTAVVRIDGRKARTYRVPVQRKAGSFTRYRFPKKLALGEHRVRITFQPTSKARYTTAKSRTFMLRVVRTRPGRGNR